MPFRSYAYAFIILVALLMLAYGLLERMVFSATTTATPVLHQSSLLLQPFHNAIEHAAGASSSTSLTKIPR